MVWRNSVPINKGWHDGMVHRWWMVWRALNRARNGFSSAPHIQHLFWDGVTSVSDDAMAELANFSGTSLFLAGVTVLAASLTSLQGWDGENLVLGLEHLFVEQAQIIYDMNVDYIGLPRLKSPSDDVILAYRKNGVPIWLEMRMRLVTSADDVIALG